MVDGGTESDTAARVIGRYVLFREVAHGGMATVHLGRLRGVGGFARTVAIKRLLPNFARDAEFVSMFLDEARLAARIQHPNVVSVLDVVASGQELFLVMEYVHGEALSKLLTRAHKQGLLIPERIAIGILVDVLYGLHAAHEARNERGDPLNIVHRDVSPQNVLVGVEGVARVLDFGIAKAAQSRHATTRVGELKGKLAYMAPEQVAGGLVDRRADVYAAGVTLWEALTGQRMFGQLEFPHLIAQILTREHVPPSRIVPGSSSALDAVVMRALERDPGRRYATAGEMAADLERIARLPSRREIGEWVARVADGPLQKRAASIAEVENTTFAETPSTAPPAPGAASNRPSRPSSSAAVRAPVDELENIEVEVQLTGDESAEFLSRVRGRRRARVWLAAAAALGAALCVVIVGQPRWTVPRSAPALATAAAIAATPSPPVVQPAEQPPTPAAPTALPPAPHLAAAPVTVAVERPAPNRRPAGGTVMPPAFVPSAEAPRIDCNPPYTVDAAGVHIPKRWCS